ncbi:MAG: PepSY domain-containing protein [Beijerinckiaceae bacterium]
MLKAWLLRLHRWTTLVFAVPLAVLIVTGLILSVEPIMQSSSIVPGSITAAQLTDIVKKADPEGKARSLSIRGFEGYVSVGLANGESSERDLKSGEEIEDGEDWLAEFMGSNRRIHEHLIGDLGWLVIASTWAMMVLMVIGVLMGLPFLRNTVGGWHRMIAWVLLPLLIISPLSGLGIAHGISLAGPTPQTDRTPVPLVDAIAIVAAKHDLSGLTSIRTRGGRLMARIYEGSELKAYAITKTGTVALPRNWTRTIHEGNWAGSFSGWLNVITSIAFIALMGTGIFIWARRTLKLRAMKRRKAAALAAAE